MSRPQLAALCLGLGALIPPVAAIITALLNHEHPFDRSPKRAAR